ncbi:MAG: ABC transporter permease [Planctomycetota bacterium]
MRIFSMAMKDLKVLFRDKMGAFFIIGFPILMGLFFGLVMGGEPGSGGSAKMKVAVVDNDQSEFSKQFVESLQANESVTIETDDLDSAKNSVRTGSRVAVLVIEPGFGKTAGLFWETPPTIKIGVDQSRTAESAMLQGYVMESIGQLASVRLQDVTELTGFVNDAQKDLAEDTEISMANRMVVSAFLTSMESMATNFGKLQTNEELSSGAGQLGGGGGFDFVNLEPMNVNREVDPNSVGGQLKKLKSRWDISFPQAIMWGVLSCVAGFSISIARERSMGTMTRLQVAPVSKLEILLGKALACFITVIFVAIMMTGLGMLLGMKPDSIPMLVIATTSVAICFVGIMMVMSLLGKTEQSVSGAGWAVNMVMAMLGGCMIPVMFMPGFMQQLSYISPIRWAILSLEGAIWREFSIGEMFLPCSILLLVGVVGLAIGTTMLSRDE